jgi:hypothetical protein
MGHQSKFQSYNFKGNKNMIYPLQISSIGAWAFVILIIIMAYYLMKEDNKK